MLQAVYCVVDHGRVGDGGVVDPFSSSPDAAKSDHNNNEPTKVSTVIIPGTEAKCTVEPHSIL